MISKESIVYSLRNLIQRKSRSFLTILSIFVGIITIFIFISFGLGLINYIESLKTESTVDKINIQPKGVGPPGLDDTFALSEEDLEAVDKTSGVIEASGVYFKPAEVRKNKELRFVWAISYDPEKPLVIEMFGTKIAKGRELRSGDSGKAVLGYNYLLKDKIFSEQSDINDRIELNGKELKIVGFFDAVGNPQDDSNIYITHDDFLEIYRGNSTGFNWIIAEVDSERIEEIIEKVEDSVRKSRNLEKGKEDFFVQSFEDLLEQFNRILLFIVVFVIAIALVSVLVSAVNTANTMVTSTLERKKEIGVMKAIGAKNSEVVKIFLFESAFLGLVAGVLGVIFGFFISYAGAEFLKRAGYGFLNPNFSPILFIGLILFAGVTGAISGTWPALRASKTRPTDALRYE